MSELSETPVIANIAEAPVVAEVANQNRRFWIFPLGLALVGVSFIFVLTVVLMSWYGDVASQGIGGQLAGTWIHVDRPPGNADQALMKVGEIVSDRVYVFSRYGTVVEQRFVDGAREPLSELKGTWKQEAALSGGGGEQAILLEFPDQKPQLMFVRFVDSRNAEFRYQHKYADSFYRTK